MGCFYHNFIGLLRDNERNKERFRSIERSAVEKCGCKKTECNPQQKRCKCVRKGLRCTTLCSCTGCRNRNENEPAFIVEEVHNEGSQEVDSDVNSDVDSDIDLDGDNEEENLLVNGGEENHDGSDSYYHGIFNDEQNDLVIV